MRRHLESRMKMTHTDKRVFHKATSLQTHAKFQILDPTETNRRLDYGTTVTRKFDKMCAAREEFRTHRRNL